MELLEKPSQPSSFSSSLGHLPKKSWWKRLGAVLRFPFQPKADQPRADKTRRPFDSTQGGPELRRMGRRRIVLGSLFFLFLLVISFLSFSVWSFYRSGLSLSASITELKASVVEKDLDGISVSLEKVRGDFSTLQSFYHRWGFLQIVPFVSSYYQDVTHFFRAGELGIETGETIISALEPHKEDLGLGSGFASQITVEQRFQNLLGTLPALADNLDLVWTNISLIREELEKINPFRYPEDFRGIKVRFWLGEAQKILDETEPLVLRGREILELAPPLLGSPRRTYLVLFQNAAELRATGGFITGFSLVTLKDGRVLANDFHSGAYFAASYPPELGVPPRSLSKYLNVGKWHFQDANYSPDFPTTAKTILGVWSKSGLPKVAGVITVNTEVSADLLSLTGPIHLAGYDLDLSQTGLPEDCRKGGRDFTSVNLICRLEFYVEKAPKGSSGTEARKVILDKISDAIIKKVSGSSAEIWPKLIDFIFEHLVQKNLMIYSANGKEQTLISSLGYSGELKSFEGDYLHINDSNFGGLKTNLYMQEEVEQSLQRLGNGIWRKTVKIKYYNPVPYDGWLSGYYKDFVRIYVPNGSKLVSVDGTFQIWTYTNQWASHIQNPAGWKENGKTVFGAYFTLMPQKECTVTFVYDLPSSVAKAMEDSGEDGSSSTNLASRGEYRLFLQKQPGTNIGLVKVQIGDTIETLDLKTDREVVISLGE